MTMVTNRKSQIISKPLTNISLAQAIEECEKEVERNVNAESDPALRDRLRGRMDLSEAAIAKRIERKAIKTVVLIRDNDIIDPKQTTVTKAETARLVDFVRSALAYTKAQYLAQEKYKNDPAKLPERQADFYGLHVQAALAGLTALDAADLLLIREGALLERLGIPDTEVDAPPLAKRLLTLEEMQKYSSDAIRHTIHPLSEWLLRAKRVGIEYIPGLDFAIEQYSSGAVKAIKPDKRKWTAADATKMQDEKNAERSKGTKNFAEVVAKRNVISASRMNKVIRDHLPASVGSKGSIAEMATTKGKR